MLKQFTYYTKDHTYQWDLDPRVNILGGSNMSGKTNLLDKIEKNMFNLTYGYGDEWVDQDFECVLPNPVPYNVIYIRPEPTFKELTGLMFKFKVTTWMTPLDMQLASQLTDLPTLNRIHLSVIRRFIPEFEQSDLSILNLPKMSTGQKQLLRILLAVISTKDEYTLLLMDTPDIYLHIDWQEKLLKSILDINPNIQIIVSTHSPSMLSGWMDKVKEINELIIDGREDMDTE